MGFYGEQEVARPLGRLAGHLVQDAIAAGHGVEAGFSGNLLDSIVWLEIMRSMQGPFDGNFICLRSHKDKSTLNGRSLAMGEESLRL